VGELVKGVIDFCPRSHQFYGVKLGWVVSVDKTFGNREIKNLDSKAGFLDGRTIAKTC
jgi:hypothetical protein